MNPSRQEIFGKVLQQIRREKGLSQEELGFESGYHRTYISLLKRGEKNPSLNAIFQISAALNVSASEMLALVERHAKDAEISENE